MPTYSALTTLEGEEAAVALANAIERMEPEPTGVGVFEIEDDSGLWEVGAYFLEKPDMVMLEVIALAFGAKPFALSELEARVRALTRRGAGGGPTVIKHGPLSFDQVGRIAYMNDHMIDLSARELGLLEVLLKRSGRLVSKEQLVDHLCEWGEEVSNNAIEVYIHRLRKKIEKGPIRIATVRGLGYCLEKIP